MSAAAVVALLLPLAARAEGTPTVADVRLVEIALATVDARGNPLIVYNPELMHAAGPDAARFFLAHEEAHHALGHILVGHFVTAATRQALELDADCAAARWLALHGDRAAVAAGAAALARQGAHAADAVHPTGATRAEHVLRCAG